MHITLNPPVRTRHQVVDVSRLLLLAIDTGTLVRYLSLQKGRTKAVDVRKKSRD
jgi:hypothetical protein